MNDPISDLTESGSETTLVRSLDYDLNETASTIPYAKDDVPQVSSFSSQESLVEDENL